MSLYGPIADPLNAAFGAGAFEFWHTGGGCTAIQAMLEGDITILITDGTTSLHGEEASITDMPNLPTTTASELPGVVTRLINEARNQL